jgi:hypothetical protein
VTEASLNLDIEDTSDPLDKQEKSNRMETVSLDLLRVWWRCPRTPRPFPIKGG